MQYEIKSIDINDDKTNLEVINLLNEVFGTVLSTEKIRLNTSTRNRKTKYLAALKDGKIAAVNFFIGHELQLNGQNLIAHQSCWTATSPAHRKKGLFTRLIEEAKLVLKQEGSAFIFGFPNHNSEGIFVNKLGFNSFEMSKLNIPMNPVLRSAMNRGIKKIQKSDSLDSQDHILTLEGESYEWKKAEYENDILMFSNYNNLIWGKKRTIEKFGRTLTYFDVGGMQVNKPYLLKVLFDEIKSIKEFDFMQIVACSDAVIWNLFKKKQNAPLVEPLIVYDLNLSTIKLKFNFFKGIKDVF